MHGMTSKELLKRKKSDHFIEQLINMVLCMQVNIAVYILSPFNTIISIFAPFFFFFFFFFIKTCFRYFLLLALSIHCLELSYVDQTIWLDSLSTHAHHSQRVVSQAYLSGIGAVYCIRLLFSSWLFWNRDASIISFSINRRA